MRIFLLLGWLLASSSALAVDWRTDMVLSPQPMTYSGPADSVTPGKIIGSTWSSTVSISEVFFCGFVFVCTKGTLQPGSGAVSSGMTVTVDGVNYTIFETGVPGVGYIIGLKDYNGSIYVPLQTGITQSYPSDGTSGYAYVLGWSAKVTFVKTGTTLKSGVYQTGTINAAILTAYYNTDYNTAKVIINPTTITVTASGCTVGTKSANVDLGTLDVRTLPTVGSTSPTGSFNVTLTCDENVAVNAVMTDQTTPSNTSSVVTLTNDSTASGVGVQFLYNGTGPLMMGPDSSAAGTTNQFFIQSTATAQTLSLPFQAQYIRTGQLVPGSANALASITFSYQ